MILNWGFFHIYAFYKGDSCFLIKGSQKMIFFRFT